MAVSFRCRLVLLLLGVALTVAGCKTAALIPTSELEKLDGFRHGDVVSLRTVQGGAYPFTSKAGLYLQMRNGDVWGFRFIEIHCADGQLVGTTATGETVKVDLDQVAVAKVATHSPGKTVGLVFGIVGGVLVAILLFYVVLIIVIIATVGLS